MVISVSDIIFIGRDTAKKRNTYRCYMDSPIGRILIEEDGEALITLRIDCYSKEKEDETALLLDAKKQLQEYFAGSRREFSLPVKLCGTDFQCKAWNALYHIPYGETRSYADIAVEIGNPKACRAIGGANNKNPVMIVIPCHRVIGADGSLVGFGGGLAAKEYLLALEKEHKFFINKYPT